MTNSNSKTTPITTALNEQGLRERPWWVEQWMELINSYRFKKTHFVTFKKLNELYNINLDKS